MTTKTAIKYELDATVRGDMGKGASRRLRHSDQVPAIVYGADKPAMALTMEHNKIHHALSHESFYSRILTLKVNNELEKVILKAVQRHPARSRIMHVDFQRIRADQKIHMRIPLHFLNEKEAPGLKEGGVISHLLSEVEVSCLPDDLPEYIEVDVGNVALNQAIHLSDLKLSKGVELVAFAHGVEDHDQPVLSIQIPRIVEEAPAIPSETEAGAVPASEQKAEGKDEAKAGAAKPEAKGGKEEGKKGK